MKALSMPYTFRKGLISNTLISMLLAFAGIESCRHFNIQNMQMRFTPATLQRVYVDDGGEDSQV